MSHVTRGPPNRGDIRGRTRVLPSGFTSTGRQVAGPDLMSKLVLGSAMPLSRGLEAPHQDTLRLCIPHVISLGLRD